MGKTRYDALAAARAGKFSRKLAANTAVIALLTSALGKNDGDGTSDIIRAEGAHLIDAFDACRKVLQIPLRGVDRTVVPSRGG